MNKDDILKRIHEDWMVLILRGDTPQQTEDTFEALIEGGATLLEVPFTTPGAGVTTEMRLLDAVKAGRFQEITERARLWTARVREMTARGNRQ
jgi:hypothetical protein